MIQKKTLLVTTLLCLAAAACGSPDSSATGTAAYQETRIYQREVTLTSDVATINALIATNDTWGTQIFETKTAIPLTQTALMDQARATETAKFIADSATGTAEYIANAATGTAVINQYATKISELSAMQMTNQAVSNGLSTNQAVLSTLEAELEPTITPTAGNPIIELLYSQKPFYVSGVLDSKVIRQQKIGFEGNLCDSEGSCRSIDFDISEIAITVEFEPIERNHYYANVHVNMKTSDGAAIAFSYSPIYTVLETTTFNISLGSGLDDTAIYDDGIIHSVEYIRFFRNLPGDGSDLSMTLIGIDHYRNQLSAGFTGNIQNIAVVPITDYGYSP